MILKTPISRRQIWFDVRLSTMMIVISPAKSLDFESPNGIRKTSEAAFLSDSQELIDVMEKKSKAQVAKLMGISDKLAELNVQRYREWQTPFTLNNARQALLAFTGDVYQGFELDQWKSADYTFAQKHLRILSGLYGLLKPLDLIQPYRLEMGTKLKTKRGRDLYDFWGQLITEAVNESIATSKSKFLVNLASNEYFRSLDQSQLVAPVITPVFKDQKNGKYKIISFFAKKARGMMANYVIQNRIKKIDDLECFDAGGYRFDEGSSNESTLTFLRDE